MTGITWKVIALSCLTVGIWWWWTYEDVLVLGQPIGDGHPTVILLHGFGTTHNDLVPLANEILAEVPRATVLLPNAPHRAAMGRGWIYASTREDAVEQLKESKASVLNAIASAETRGISSSDIYLGGFSQGAQLALDVGAGPTIGRRLAGLMLLSGGAGQWPGSVNEVGFSGDNLVANHRILISHERRDEVVPFSRSDAAAQRLRDAGLNATLLPFEAGHTIPAETRAAMVEVIRQHSTQIR